MKLPMFPLVALALLALASCHDPDPTPPGSGEPNPPAEIQSPPPAPKTTYTLPQTGDITTGALTPSAPATRLATEAEKAQVVGALIDQVKNAQAAGLKDARVTVHAAWPYTGYSTLAPDPDSAIPARLVAIELTVEGHTAAFDPDDIEIVDGITSVSYGSNPHLTALRAAGEVRADPKEMPRAPEPVRLLLIYAFPKATRSFTLYYWGQKLLPQPRDFDASGWSLPFPAQP